MTRKSKNYQSPTLDYESPVLMMLSACTTKFVCASLIDEASYTVPIEEGEYGEGYKEME